MLYRHYMYAMCSSVASLVMVGLDSQPSSIQSLLCNVARLAIDFHHAEQSADLLGWVGGAFWGAEVHNNVQLPPCASVFLASVWSNVIE